MVLSGFVVQAHVAKISVDSKEAAAVPKVVEALREGGVEVEVKPLPCDYAVEVDGGWAVERKTATDLVGSVRSGRLWGELEKLKMLEGLRPILLVEGSLALVEKFTGWNPVSVVGVLNSVIFDWGVSAVFVPSRRWTVAYLIQLAKSAEAEGKRPRPLKIKERAEKVEDYVLMVAESLPGVSAVRARALLERFGTLRRLFGASVEELMEVEGIGEKTARKIFEVANFDFASSKRRNA